MQPCPQQAGAVMAAQAEHQSRWEVRPYDGGPYDHGLRTCSYCGSLHPDDVIALVRSGRPLEGTSKRYKAYISPPNLVAGKRVRTGSESGPVFGRIKPTTRVQRILGPHDMPARLGQPTLMERLIGRYDRKIFGVGTATAFGKVYFWHFTDAELAELRSAATTAPA